MSEVIVLQHDPCEGLGNIGIVLQARNLEPRYFRSFAGDKIPEHLDTQALIVMGGPMSVYEQEQEQYPFLAAELQLIRRTIDAGRPVLGISLGSQLLAAALEES